MMSIPGDFYGESQWWDFTRWSQMQRELLWVAMVITPLALVRREVGWTIAVAFAIMTVYGSVYYRLLRVETAMIIMLSMVVVGGTIAYFKLRNQTTEQGSK